MGDYGSSGGKDTMDAAPFRHESMESPLMNRKLALIVATLCVFAFPAAAQADSGLTPTVSPFSYGGIPAGQSYYNPADPIVLTNTTGLDVTLGTGADTVTSSNDGWSWIGVGGGGYPSCVSLTPVVVAPGASCTVVPYVGWKGTLGETTATLTVHSDQGITDIPVSAIFQASVAQYVANNDSWFPQVVGPAVKTHTFFVKNDGNIALHTTSVTLVDGAPSPSFHVVADGCSGEPVAPGATCPITVSFDGPSDWKTSTDLIVTTDATHALGAGPTLDFSMTGVRIRLAVLSYALSANRFAPVGADGTRHAVRYTFKTTNPAHVTLQVVNSLGRVVKSWTWQCQHAGYRGVSWLGHDNWGGLVKQGTYHFRVRLEKYGTTHYGGYKRVVVKRLS